MALDFRQLMREERQRARREQAAAATVASSDSSAVSATSTTSNDGDTSAAPASRSAADANFTTPLRTWSNREPLQLDSFGVDGISRVYYVPEWIAVDEEQAILERVYAIPDEDDSVWVALKRRRLQMWGGEVKAPFRAQPLPAWLLQIVQSLVDAEVFSEAHRPNHALINEYGVGEGIMPHEDGPSYFPFVAIVSAGADSTVTFEPHRTLRAASDLSEADASSDDKDGQTAGATARLSFQLERRSLLLFTGDAYTRFLHSIDGVERGKRVSLTIRHVRL